MITLYLSCLVVGGVFVGLSALGAVGKDIDADHDVDADIGLGAGIGAEADVDADVDIDADADVDADADADIDADHSIAVVDGSHGLTPHKRKLWLPVLSFRFWTFGAAFFGLMGTLLTTLTAASALFVALTSATTGVGVGTLSAWMVRWLRRPVGASVRLAEYSGSVGELMLPLREGGVTRIRLRVQGRERTMLAATPEPRALPSGTRVVVLGIDDDGRAQIEPEQNIYNTEE